jgi:hypothetical protein
MVGVQIIDGQLKLAVFMNAGAMHAQGVDLDSSVISNS